MYCTHCGKEMPPLVSVCPACKAQTREEKNADAVVVVYFGIFGALIGWLISNGLKSNATPIGFSMIIGGLAGVLCGSFVVRTLILRFVRNAIAKRPPAFMLGSLLVPLMFIVNAEVMNASWSIDKRFMDEKRLTSEHESRHSELANGMFKTIDDITSLQFKQSNDQFEIWHEILEKLNKLDERIKVLEGQAKVHPSK